jgi:hypothetical protein
MLANDGEDAQLRTAGAVRRVRLPGAASWTVDTPDRQCVLEHLIGQYALKLMHDHFTRICKFNDVVVRFIPVKIVPVVRSIAPKAKAAANRRAA